MNLKDRISTHIKKRQDTSWQGMQARAMELEAELEELTPMFKQIQEGLECTDLEVVLHTDTNHYPCPAIHIKGLHSAPFNKISEIFKNGQEWKTGSCNSHLYTHATDDDLLDFIAEAVAANLSMEI